MIKDGKGLSFFEVLQIVFIVLKLCKVINWSWWWVLSPSLIPLGIVIILYLIKAFVLLMEKRGSDSNDNSNNNN